MADSYRIKIHDKTGSDNNKSSLLEETSEVKSFERQVDTSGQTTSSKKYNNSNSNSLISESSNNLSKNTSYNNQNTHVSNNSDIFSEDNVNNYNLLKVDNTQELIYSGASGVFYRNINNLIAKALEASNSNIDKYYDIKDVSQSEKDNAVQFLYKEIKDIANSKGDYSNGRLINGSKNSYNKVDENLTISESNKATSKLSGGGISSAYSSLNDFDPNTSLLDVADLTVYKALNDSYKNINNVETKSNSSSNNSYRNNSDVVKSDSLSNFLLSEYLDINSMSEWNTMTYPDAMSNMYDVYFRVRNDSDGLDEQLEGNIPILKALFDGELLSARISSIQIPSYQRSTGTIDFASNKIEKPLDKIDTPGKSSFTIRGDSRLCYVTAFNELAGTDIGSFFGKGEVVTAPLMNSLVANINHNYQEELDKIFEKWKETEKKYKEEYKKRLEYDSMNQVGFLLVNGYDINIPKLKEEYVKINGNANGLFTWIMSSKIEEINEKIEKAEKELNDTVESLKKNQLSLFSYLIEKRKIKDTYKEIIDSLENDLKKLNETQQIYSGYRKNIESQYKSKKSEFEAEVKEAGENRKKDIQSLCFVPTGFNYLIESLNKNVSVVASKISDSDEGQLTTFLQNHPRLDIIVKRSNPSKTFTTIASYKKDERFVFEDVKIIGTSNAIEFKKNDSGVVNFTYEFIYKRFYKEDIYDNTDKWIKSYLEYLIDNYIIENLKENR